MPRPPTPVGTYGEINVKLLGPKKYEAEAYFRMGNGHSKRVSRRGPTRTAATNRLKDAMANLASEVRGDMISSTTRITRIAHLWHEELEREAKVGDRSANTVRNYWSAWTNWVLPATGELQARELTVTTCDKLVKKAHDARSYDTAKSVRAVLGGICAYAVRHGAMTINPVRSVGRLARGQRKEVVALSLSQRQDLLAKLDELALRKQVDTCGRRLGRRGRVWLELPDVVRAMLATGVRLGELLALSGEDIDPTKRTVSIGCHLVRVTGVGLVRVPNRKGNGRGLLLRVPQWSVSMLRRRKSAVGSGPLFATGNGTWLDPSNVIHRIREGFADCGYEWVTSHVFRKTVAAVLDEADLPLTAIADQLGNTPGVTETHYRPPKVTNDASAAALEGMISEPTE
jgi:integrase